MGNHRQMDLLANGCPEVLFVTRLLPNSHPIAKLTPRGFNARHL